MKTRMLVFLLVGGFVALAAWLVHAPKSAQADEVPEKYRDTVHKGLEYLVKKQHKDGHWEGDDVKHPVAMTGLVGLALLLEGSIQDMDGERVRSVDGKYWANVQSAVDWFMDRSRAERDGLIFSEHASETARYMEGHGLATLLLHGGAADYEPCKDWVKYCEGKIPKGAALKFGQDELSHYYYAQFMLNTRGWADYRTLLFDHLQKSQNKDGSWPAADGISVGSIYATALWCTVLQLDRRCHPSRRYIAYAN